MATHHVILATSGHVDHGKSALIKALTGTDPDRLPEEKARGITIDLGFAHLELPVPLADDPEAVFSVGIVDVPGHEDFVKNMVAGVGSVDLAMMVVAADDGWMPQTEEHLQILEYLGVGQALVALTKIDLAEGREEEIRRDLRDRLRGSSFEDAPIVATSVTRGRGLEALKQALAEMLGRIPPPENRGRPRLPVDRVFSLQGIGTVVTGTLTGGMLEVGQAVVVQPSGASTRIRSLQHHNLAVDRLGPGSRGALNLPDMEMAARGQAARETGIIRRGDVVTLAGIGRATRMMDVLLSKSPRLKGASHPAARPLKDGARVVIHHGSGHVAARLQWADSQPLEPGGRQLARLRCEDPIFVLAGDRFILRDWSEQWTLGGGVVLDPEAEARKFSSESQQIFLRNRARAPLDPVLHVSSRVEVEHHVRVSELHRSAPGGPESVAQALKHLGQEGKATVLGEWVVDTAWWNDMCRRAERRIREEHQARPELPGLAVPELRKLISSWIPVEAGFDLIWPGLEKVGFTKTGQYVRHQGHRPALPQHLQAAGQALRLALQEKPMEPPSKKELLARPQAAPALRFLVENGEAVDLGPDTVLSAEAFDQAKAAIRRYLTGPRGATASDLRKLLGTSRRVIIPLLERLDRDGITLRQGDQRVLRQP